MAIPEDKLDVNSLSNLTTFGPPLKVTLARRSPGREALCSLPEPGPLFPCLD